MSPQPEYLRLRRLLDESLHPYSDTASNTLTKEMEKDLLFTLSQVFRQVKQWTHEFDDNEEPLAAAVVDRGCSVAVAPQCDIGYCLATIITDLMSLLAIKSQYAQHLVGNILVAISEFVLILDNSWDDFIHLLCLCLELAISNILTSTEPGAFEARYLHCDPTISEVLLKLKQKGSDWSMVAAIIRVVRNIQKLLKQDFNDQIMTVYLDSISSLMLNLPWNILSEIDIGHHNEAPEGSAKKVLQVNVVQSREMTVFFGSFIQFLCSLVTQSSVLDNEVDFSPVICKIIDLVPKLTAWCHADLQSPYYVRISHYFRHKVLMLMIKLSSTIHIKQTVLVIWIQLIHKYFKDPLLQLISGGEFDQDSFLDGSPFCTSMSDRGKQNMFSSHLQRLSVFLFLKCSLNLVSLTEGPDESKCSYENLKHYCSGGLNLGSECQSNSIGLIELNEWIQAHVPADILANNELYFERCVRFTLSFLQLFMHEDDILFEMLLQLFRVPSCLDRMIMNDGPLAESNNHLVFLAIDLFNPIHLFHLFLAEIHYDHQVLLDYLISKDTGSSCAEYLLRSLRSICDSWGLFVEFPGVEGLDQLCPKRKEVLINYMKFKGVLTPTLSKDGGKASLVKKHNEVHGAPFFASRHCLISLRTSINNLNQKNLFPYNPQVLLRRLSNFQELAMSKS